MIRTKDNREKEPRFFNNRPALYQQLGRNLKGFGLERNGRKDEAIRLYEENVKENFEGTYPYARLARIYRDKNRCFDVEVLGCRGGVPVVSPPGQSSLGRE